MRRFILVTAITALAFSTAFAQTPADTYNAANKLYLDGDALGALELYNSIEVVNPQLAYNRASAYFKLGRLGKAVVHFNRALRLHPGDKATIENLGYIRSIKKDKEEPVKPGMFSQIINVTSLSSMTWIAVFLYLLLAALVVTRISAVEKTVKRKLATITTIVALVTICWGAATGARIYNFENSNIAVAVADEAQAYSGPSENADKVFIFHEGTEVAIQRVEGSFAMVTLSSGLSGWTKLSELERI